MKISEFKNIIQHLKYIVFGLPEGKKVPSYFHNQNWYNSKNIY